MRSDGIQFYLVHLNTNNDDKGGKVFNLSAAQFGKRCVGVGIGG